MEGSTDGNGNYGTIMAGQVFRAGYGALMEMVTIVVIYISVYLYIDWLSY